MQVRILKDFETFSEFPDGVLLVEKNSNLTYIKTTNGKFLTREFVDSVIGDNRRISYTVKYLDVLNNKERLTINIDNAPIDKRKFKLDDSILEITPLTEKVALNTYIDLRRLVKILKLNDRQRKILLYKTF